MAKIYSFWPGLENGNKAAKFNIPGKSVVGIGQRKGANQQIGAIPHRALQNGIVCRF